MNITRKQGSLEKDDNSEENQRQQKKGKIKDEMN